MKVGGLNITASKWIPRSPRSCGTLSSASSAATGFSDRAHYKIYYCQIREAPILTLGYNPGGAPSNTNPDGRTHRDRVVAAASASYHEQDEHDILDCEWKENRGLRSLLVPLVGSLSAVRQKVVKTNMAFHRSAKKKDIDMERAMDQTAPFLAEVLRKVRPKLVLLTGPSVSAFSDRASSKSCLPRGLHCLERPESKSQWFSWHMPPSSVGRMGVARFRIASARSSSTSKATSPTPSMPPSVDCMGSLL